MSEKTDPLVEADRLRKASAAYYGSGEAIMSDFEFDQRVECLRTADPSNPFLAEIGSKPASGKAKVRRVVPMLSLKKMTSAKEVAAWFAQFPGTLAVLEPKADGASLEIIYKDGVLSRALTRGDGYVGEDVTVAVRRMNIPHSIRMHGEVSVRGEVVLPFTNWQIVDPEMKTNPRNVGTGILTRDDGSQAEMLEFLAYDALVNNACPADTEPSVKGLIKGWGFEVLECERVDADVVMTRLEQFNARRRELPFATDGAVLRFYSKDDQLTLGISSGRPNGQAAFKWKSEEAVTKLEGVTITVGHTGNIIPTARLSPVKLMGVTISNALLNNWEEIDRLGVRIGDYVRVVRTGEIIPKIIGVEKTSEDSQPIPRPTHCHICGHATEKAKTLDEEAGALIVCPNYDCEGRAKGRVKLWLKTFDILGAGDDVIDALFAADLVKSPIDLYQLSVEQISSMPVGSAGAFGAKRAGAFITQIVEKGTTDKLNIFLGALGVPYLGKRRAEILADSNPYLRSLDAWLDGTTLIATLHEAQGRRMEHVIAQTLGSRVELVRALAAVAYTGDSSPSASEPVTSVSTDAKTIVLTGKFSVQKSELEALIAAAGHKTADSVGKGVDFLVQADPSSASNKTKKASTLGIKVIDEAQLRKMLSVN